MNDLEFLKEIFKDQRMHIGIGTIVQLGISQDKSILRVMVNLLPEGRQVVAEYTFADLTDVTYPLLNDLAIVAFCDGQPDECFVLKLVSTKDEPVPTFATQGHSVRQSRPKTKLYLASDTKIGIGRPAIEPASPLVLGDIMVNCMTDFLNAFLNAAQVGQSAMGPVVLDPSVRQALSTVMQKYISTTSTNIVSQIAFTERGV